MKRMITTIGAVCLVVALVVLSVTSCAEPKPAAGGVLRIGYTESPTVLGYPPTLMALAMFPFVRACEETLLTIDEAGTPAPWLVTDWEENPEALTITFHLREGVKFHDGTDFNAAAVKWNLDQFRAANRAELRLVESIDIIDDYTVRLNLSEYDVCILTDVTGYAGFIISPTAFEKYGQEWCENNPVGTGPFKFVSWDKDVSVKFERFDDYWQEGKPYLDRVEFSIIKDPMVLMAAFQAGEVDIVLNTDPKDAADMRAMGKFNIVTCAGDIRVLFTDSAHEDAPYHDARVRKALTYAIDRQAICDALGYGFWNPIDQFSVPGRWSWNSDVVGYTYDPDKARELLAEAGYPNGFKTKLYTPTAPAFVKDYMTAIQNNLIDIGIDAEIELIDSARMRHIAVIGGWEGGIVTLFMAASMPNEFRPLSAFFTPGSILFQSNIRPPEYQDVLTQALKEPDFETRKALMHQLQKLATDDYCMVNYLWHAENIAVKYPEVHGDLFYERIASLWMPSDAWIER